MVGRAERGRIVVCLFCEKEDRNYGPDSSIDFICLVLILRRTGYLIDSDYPIETCMKKIRAQANR